MPSHPHESEAPPAEAVLIRRAREARGLSPEQAAQRLKIKLSGRRWRQLEEGREHSTGKPAEMGDAQLAHMAHDVGVTAEQLTGIGRHEAAEILREIQRQERQHKEPAPAEPQPEIPSYVTSENTEDWEWEIWANLLLLTPEEKAWIIAVIGDKRRRDARAAEDGGHESDQRRHVS
jgi:transcriptional regulator with XRE-family HTH domain